MNSLSRSWENMSQLLRRTYVSGQRVVHNTGLLLRA
ncbi:MAG: hypothetical protein RI932_130, partial [Pseudomonadota bacterium]